MFMPETIVREFVINFDSDGHPNGSLNEYHVGKIRQGDNLINRVKVTFAAGMSPTQVQLHCKRPDGSLTPDTELMTLSNGNGYYYYDLSNWFSEYEGQLVFNLSLSFTAVGGETPKLYTGGFIIFVESSSLSNGNFSIDAQQSILDILNSQYYTRTYIDSTFLQIEGDQYFALDTTPTIDVGDLPDGAFFWNQDKYTYSYKDTLGEILDISQFLGGIGKNAEGGTVYEGQPVAFSGVQGSHKTFAKANASQPSLSQIVGVVNKTVSTNGFAFCSVFGEFDINDFTILMESGNTTGLQAGSKLYLSAAQSGTYTLTIPIRPYAAIWVASVISYNSNNHKGRLFVFPHRERVDGDATIVVSNDRPANQIEGDFWYDIR